MTQSRTPLHPSSAVSIAVAALAAQGQYGIVTELAREHDVPRKKVYSLRETARAALHQVLSPETTTRPTPPAAPIDSADLHRAILALRVVTPASFRDIEDLAPILFGRKVGYGTIVAIVHEAERRAAELNRTDDYRGVQTIVLDEMFSQGHPVFAGIDPDSGALLLLEPHKTRTGQQWADALGPLAAHQGLAPARVVKDAGSGLALGVQTVWPGIEENDDLFHASYLLGQQQIRLYRRAIKEMTMQMELEAKRARYRKAKKRRSLGQQIRAAKGRTERAIERHDQYERLQRRALAVLELSDRGSGALRTKEEVVRVLTEVAAGLRALGGKQICKVASYLENRAVGLGQYLDELAARLVVARQQLGEEVVAAGVRAYQASLMVHRGGPMWDRAARRSELHDAVEALLEATGRAPDRLLLAFGAVLPVLAGRHRASSSIENLNSVLRPYLVVHKHAGAGFMQLFRFWWNRRKRRWGRFAGTSAHELLTGEVVEDWLTTLGFPPSSAAARRIETSAAAAA